MAEEPTDPPVVSVLYESGPCLAVLKPGGLLTQAPRGIPSLEERVRSFLRRREGKKGGLYLGVPHRLDRPASGVVVMARHQRATRRLAEQFAGRMVTKKYWAILEGELASPSGRWRDYLAKRPDQAHVDVVESHTPGAKEARLGYRVISAAGGFTWVEIELETGRTHQIRVQASARGAPIVGDEQYGARTRFGRPVNDPRARLIALHGRSIRFKHPMTREWVVVEAPLPDAWASFDPSRGAARD